MPVVDSAGTFDVARALGLAPRDPGAGSSARPIAAELVALLEEAPGAGAAVPSLDVERARRGR